LIQSFTFNPLGENTYVIWDETTLEAAIIDAGMYSREECETVKNFLDSKDLKLKYLWGTHAHIDHIFGNWWIKQEFPEVPYYLHADDIKMIQRSETMAALWNLNYTPSPEPDSHLSHKQILQLGNSRYEVRFVPGHAPGHVIFVNFEADFAVVGDCIFQGSIGRTDLPGGNHEQLLQKIEEEIFTLPANMQLFCGHGPSTTVGREIEHNPFFNN
jgi:glyoxylase-like metal-dependent hydrolase (beta-lactamase superfamily II)